MKIVGLWFIIFSIILNTSLGWANTAAAQENMCPVNMALSQAERDVFIGFHARLSHLNRHYGKNTFQAKLNQIIAQEWPVQKVIEISPTFMERALNLIDQQYLKDAIASTIGLDHPLWNEFERVMKKVTLLTYTTENKHGKFTRKTEELISAINSLSQRQMKTPNTTREQRDILKGRAVTRIANMVIYLERWSIINVEITKQRAEAAGRQLFLNALGLTAGGVLIASIVYAGPIVAGAGAIGAKLSADIVIAAQLARLGQVIAAAGMGAAGAPTGLLLTDTTAAVLEAQRLSANNGTVYACELDRQINAWKQEGVSPYLKAALVGGSIGLGGGVLTLSQAGAKVVLLATTFGISVAQLYTLGQINDNSMKSMAEYRLAMEEHEKGNNEQARIHLQNSRRYAQEANESLLETIVVGALSASISTGFKAALLEGESAIRVLFANSSDTLPMAVGIATESIQQLTGQQ